MGFSEQDRRLVETYDWKCDRCGREAVGTREVSEGATAPYEGPVVPVGWRAIRLGEGVQPGGESLAFCQRSCMSVYLADFVAKQFPDVASPKRLRQSPDQGELPLGSNSITVEPVEPVEPAKPPKVSPKRKTDA